MHFGLPTFWDPPADFLHTKNPTYHDCTTTSIDRGNQTRGSYPCLRPDLFSPTDLDADDWMRHATAMGMKEICLTAHHEGGFALWPSNYTEYSVAASSWRGGKGDVLREFADGVRDVVDGRRAELPLPHGDDDVGVRLPPRHEVVVDEVAAPRDLDVERADGRRGRRRARVGLEVGPQQRRRQGDDDVLRPAQKVVDDVLHEPVHAAAADAEGPAAAEAATRRARGPRAADLGAAAPHELQDHRGAKSVAVDCGRAPLARVQLRGNQIFNPTSM